MASKTPSTISDSEAAKSPPAYEMKELAELKLKEKTTETSEEEKSGKERGDGSIKASWDNPPVNKYRLLSCFIIFIAMSLNLSSYGVIIPQLEEDYNIPHTTVSLIFVAPFFGAVLAAATTNKTHLLLGRRGAGAVSCTCMAMGNLFIALHPPWPAIPVITGLTGYGTAGLDPFASAWVGTLHHSAGFMGMAQGCFGIGSTIAPLIANALIENGIPYYNYYYIPFVLSMVAVVVVVASFWGEDGEKYARDMSGSKKSGKGHAGEILNNKVSWILASFVLVNWGVESTIGSWIVVYLTNARGGSSSSASLVNSMFWLSYTIGRFVLVWLVGLIPLRWRGKGSVTFFILAALMLELMFWLLPTFVGSSVAACLLGFFCGPLYPMVLTMLTKLLPPHLHVTAIGIGSALGAAGSTVFPIAAGAISQHRGIAMIHPLVLGIYAAELVLWYFLPGLPS